MFRVLTVAREYGSGGGAIARKIADKLGWDLLDKALVERIARIAQVDPEWAQQCDEHIDLWMHRVSRRGLWHGAFDGVATVTDLEVFDAESMAALARNLITEAHVRGNCVIVRATDQQRGDYIRMYFGFNWNDPHLYHMLISSEFGEDNVARMVMDSLEWRSAPCS